jgi:hypothetical protein
VRITNSAWRKRRGEWKPNSLKPWLPNIERRLLAQKLAPHYERRIGEGKFSKEESEKCLFG